MLKMRLLISLCALLGTDVLIAMQQQEQIQTQEQEQAQIQIKKKKKKDPQGNQDNQSDSDAMDAVTADPQNELQLQMAAIMASINDTYGSVDSMIKVKMKDHVRMCPTCTRTSAECPTDQDRIRNGNIMPCACSFCRGRDNKL